MTLRVHPDNPKLFEFNGRPLVLLCATEHYGAVLNRPFRFERYLEDAASKGQTLTRLFTLFRELQSPLNPYSTCKPESTDFVTPFKRSGPGKALDGLPRFDLTQRNDEYFDRLDAFVKRAGDYGIVVEVVLFSNTYDDEVWQLNPLHPDNNVNLDAAHPLRWQDYVTERNVEILHWQEAHARSIVEHTQQYDNVIYEICNEPGSFRTDDDLPGADEVNAWQSRIIELVRSIQRESGRQHLIAGQQAFYYDPEFEQPADLTFDKLAFDVVNMHPLPNTSFREHSYQMGDFMSKQLKLTAVRDFALVSYGSPKPLNYDEDNVATRFLDPEGWTVHRKRAWTTALSGAHYDMIDFSIIPGRETGTSESSRCIRTWMGHLSQFIHSVDLVHARPLPIDWLLRQPAHTIASVLAIEGEDYCIYLADGREREEADRGEPIEGALGMTLPDGEFTVSTYAPETGLYSPALPMDGGSIVLDLPVFHHDVVIRIRRADAP
ncbi:MAG: hypothetical protein CME19_02530 [Gemmatimonadetes bacterium]|nr:hypothetical protein [Gemmatimonadota bacterium]